jgi:hypothetical protein
MSYILFTSYRREMIDHPPHAAEFHRFLGDLNATVKQKISGRRGAEEEMCFLDTGNIELGMEWPDELQKAASASKICLSFIYPGYFISKWCGQEFNFFRERQAPVIPVLWHYAANMPERMKRLQLANNQFPVDYWDKGLQSIMLMLEDRSRVAYQRCLEALAERITQVYTQGPIPPTNLTLASMPGWEPPAPSPADAAPHSGNISKASFVFMAGQGWNWKPYNGEDARTIGALAQSVSADLNIQYEEMPCEGSFDADLRARRDANVPTILLADPLSMEAGLFKERMRVYDDLFLLNCGTILAWPEGSLNGPSTAWDRIQRDVCPQKTLQPPPFHEWRTIYSHADLKNRTKAVTDGIRQTLLQKMLQDRNVTVRKAENAQAASEAADKGISVTTPPQLCATAPVPRS